MAYLHLFFIIFFFNHFHYSMSADIEVLLSFKLKINDPQNALSGWSQNSSHCTWSGVSCTTNGTRVQSLSLPGLGLSGSLPSQLSNLTFLNKLDLGNNSFHGQIPLEFGNLLFLTVLSLSRNHFVGEIPNELGRLRKLRHFQLSTNNFTGEIPSSIFNISSLIFFSVTENSLSGKLPSDFGRALPNLKKLYLAQNKFEGIIPNSISNVSQIQHLDLSFNSFQGLIPLLGSMSNLVSLNLGNNSLSSNTKHNFQLIDSLRNCTKLEIFKVFGNKLAGEFPSSVANLSIHLQQFCVDDNMLSGNFPIGFENFPNLISLALEKNSFTGELPNTVSTLTNLQKLTLHLNKFHGEIPDIFVNLTKLYVLTMGSNQFSGRIPPSIGVCQQLSVLGLVANRLNGSIPDEIFGLSSLTQLRLAKNSLSGPLPGEVGSLKQLEYIDVSDNQLSGDLPTTIGGCTSLKDILMARNNITGSIPSSIGDLASLVSLDLSSNSLSGPIPEDLGKLEYLKMLNLSFNQLEGEVPRDGFFKNLSLNSLEGNDRICVSNQESAGMLGLPQCTTKKTKGRILLTIIASVAGLTLLISLISALVCMLKIRKKNKKRKESILLSQPSKWLLPVISYSDIWVATDNFTAENLIGKGGFGSVFKGNFSNTILAVKVLDLHISKASQSFIAECEALRNAKHRNLVKVITSCSGVDHKGNEFKALVMELMSNGNLDQWLYPKDEESGLCLTLLQRLNIAIDVATAIDYLHHDSDPQIVHCDLKPGNVLLDADMVAHVGDFGLARFISQNPSQNQSSTIGLRGSIGYIAPEYGQGGKASTSGDVYSFGILLLEMMMAKKPTNVMFTEGSSLVKLASETNENRVLEIADPRLFMYTESLSISSSYTSTDNSSNSSSSTGNVNSNWHQKDAACVAFVIRVGLSCAAQSTKDRTTMRETLAKLHEIKKFLLSL